MAKISINEALAWQKTLKERHSELMGLRNENSFRETRYIGADANKEKTREPLYDVVHLDAMITRVAREMRLIDTALKVTNAQTTLVGYEHDEAVLGELKPVAK